SLRGAKASADTPGGEQDPRVPIYQARSECLSRLSRTRPLLASASRPSGTPPHRESRLYPTGIAAGTLAQAACIRAVMPQMKGTGAPRLDEVSVVARDVRRRADLAPADLG